MRQSSRSVHPACVPWSKWRWAGCPEPCSKLSTLFDGLMGVEQVHYRRAQGSLRSLGEAKREPIEVSVVAGR